MDSDNKINSIFDKLKIRSLVIWLTLGLIFILSVNYFSLVFLYETVEEIEKHVEKHALLYFMLYNGLFIYLFFLLWLISKLKKSNISLKKFIGKFPTHRNWKSWISITLGLITFSLGAGYFIWSPLLFFSPDYLDDLRFDSFFSDNGTIMPISDILVSIIAIDILAPIFEELFYRGVLLQRWAIKWGMRSSILITSLLFGILHYDFVGAFFFSLTMSVLYIKTRTLLIPIFCHSFHNATFSLLGNIESLIYGSHKMTESLISSAWFGGVCLTISVPWVIYFIYKNWPKKECDIPLKLSISETI